MIIQNALVFQEDGSFAPQPVYMEGAHFSSHAQDGPVLDGQGCYLIPGLVDLHFHGCVGHDFCEGTDEAFNAIAAYEAQNGVTTICPATMTFPEERLAEVCRTAAAWSPLPGMAALLGINLEGPFLSAAKKGAQNGTYLHAPDAGFFRRLQEEAGGLIKLLAIAPELPGAMEMITQLKNEVVLSAAHTTADYDTAAEAFSKGVSHVTHLYNAMPPLSHRAPGVIGAAFDAPATQVELICDGIHIHPGMVRATFQLFGDDRILLISDSMMATGMPAGNYELGGQAVTVENGRATLEDGTIAGSAANLMDCLRVAVKRMGIPLASAVKCASVNPAKSIGIFDRAGSIAPGKSADCVLLDQDLNIRQIILRGEVLSRS